MKGAWKVISVIALANIVAVAALVGWLAVSGRLDTQRMQDLRAMLSETVAERDARLAAEASEAEAAAAAADEAANLARPALTATQQYDMRIERTMLDQQRVERLRRDVEDLERTLDLKKVALDADISAFERERSAFEATRARLTELEGSAQFRKSLSVLEGLRAPAAKSALMELIEGRVEVLDGPEEASAAGVTAAELGKEQAVAYLNAMQGRVRTKVMAEFVKDDTELAAELLERLRMHGLTARAPGDDGG
ncbi:MAG: hypothetical protein AAF138_08200 [Planctomycetota bacterium]